MVAGTKPPCPAVNRGDITGLISRDSGPRTRHAAYLTVNTAPTNIAYIEPVSKDGYWQSDKKDQNAGNKRTRTR